MWKRSLLILVTNWHKTSHLNISLLENRNLWTSIKASNSKTWLSEPILPILPYRIYYSIHGGVNVWLSLFRVLSGSVLFRILRDRVLFRVLYRGPRDRVLFRVLSNRVLFRVLSNMVLFRVLVGVLSNRILFWVPLRIFNDSILFRALSPRFLVCRVPSVASTTWGVLQWFSVLNISIATDVLILSLGNLMQLREIWASFWKEKKGFILDFWLGSEYAYAESFIFRSIHPDGIPKDSFSERFFKIYRKVSLTEYFPKKV